MRRVLLISAILLTATPAAAQLLPSLGEERAGTSGFQFLKIPVDARSAALGDAVVTSPGEVSALYWNPALAAWAPGPQAGFHHTAYFVDVALDYAGVVLPVRGTNLALGASLQTMRSGDMDVTTEFQPFGTGETFGLLDLAAGLTLSQRLTDLFSYGLTGKFVQESVAGLTARSVVFDLGFFYRVGTTGLDLAVAVRNFGIDAAPEGSLERPVIATPPVVVETDFEAITPPTSFHLGVAWDAMRDTGNGSLRLLAQLNKPNDNAEHWSMGAEYAWNGALFLRTGYRIGVDEVVTPAAGVGIRIPMAGASLRFDYSFDHLERLGAVHRMGVNLGL